MECDQYENKIVEALLIKSKAETEVDNQFRERNEKLYAVCSKYAGYTINNRHNFSEFFYSLEPDMQGRIEDEAFAHPETLCLPSHKYKPYSLRPINESNYLYNLDLHISIQDRKQDNSGLDILFDSPPSRMYERAEEIIREDLSYNTQLAHEGDLIYWEAWLSAIGFTFDNPISKREISLFIVQHAENIDHDVDERLVKQGYKFRRGRHSMATIKRRVASLSVYIDLFKERMLNNGKFDNPCKDTEIRMLLQKLTKKYGGSKPAGKAITKDVLNDMLDTCKNTLIDKRDKALLLFAWASGGRRRSEVTNATFENLTKQPDGNYVYKIIKSKTDQEGKGMPVPVKGWAARALTEWLESSGITEGALFRSITKGGVIGSSLAPNGVYRIVQSRLKKAGYNEKLYGAHSLRSGFVTEAGRKGKPIRDVMQMTTHRNVETVMRYYQEGNISNNSAANLLDE